MRRLLPRLNSGKQYKPTGACDENIQRGIPMNEAVLLKDIVKVFPGTIANDHVTITIRKNSIHGIVGENGAGKTTLMKQLYGMYRPDGGEIWLNGKKATFHSPKDAISCRIGMVHQHFTLVNSMSVVENIILGRPVIKHGFVDIKKAKEEISQLCRKYNFEMDLDAKTEDLPVGLKQRVEILKALYLGADVLIMDEPTAVLTPQEITELFATLRSLRDLGASIILITHKLSEVIQLTDEVTVLRDGKVTGHVLTKDTNEQELARMMIGRGLQLHIDKQETKDGEKALCVKNIRCRNDDGIMVVDDVSFEVRYGEIVGIAGVQGNGQTELIEVISGMNQEYGGTVEIDGQGVPMKASPWQRRTMGLGHIPEDRQIQGSAPEATIEDNFLMTTYRKPEINYHSLISRKKAMGELEAMVGKFKIKIPGCKAKGSSLSGGNMQKLIFAREYNLNPKCLIAAQPTRGVDIGAMEFIHNRLVEMRDQGKAVLLVSNELSEIMLLSDRVLVMYEGKISGEVKSGELSEEKIGLLMAGITGEKEAQDVE